MSEFLYVNSKMPSRMAKLCFPDGVPEEYRSEYMTFLYRHGRLADKFKPAFSNDKGRSFHMFGRPFLVNTDGMGDPANGLKTWIAEGSFPNAMNGYGCLLGFDQSAKKFYLLSDTLGLYPIFQYNKDGLHIVSSNIFMIHSVLRCLGIEIQHNMDAVAEFLATGSCIHPETYLRNVTQVNNATKYVFHISSGKLLAEEKFWSASLCQPKNYRRSDEAAKDLAILLKNSIQKRTTEDAGKIGLMLSAGADSRAILFASKNSQRITCYTMYDEPNEELKLASKLANIANSKHVKIQRELDYYFKDLKRSTLVSSGMWSIDSAHYTGAIDRVKSDQIDTLLTGCYADYLFKGLAIDRSHVKFLGKNLPLYKLSNQIAHDWYQPYFSLNEQYAAVTESRLARRYDGTQTGDKFSSINAIMSARLCPMIREADASGRHTLRATGMHDFIISEQSLINFAFSLPIDLRLNGIVFGKAVSELMPKEARHIVNNNFGAPLAAGKAERIAYFLLNSAKRKLSGSKANQPFEKNPSIVATHGSWPHFPRVLEVTNTLQNWEKNNKNTFGYDFVVSMLKGYSHQNSHKYWVEGRTQLFMRACVAVEALNQLES